MPLPGDLTKITVTGSWVDGSGNALTGYVTFAPSTDLTDSTGHAIIRIAQVQANLTAGAISVSLACTDNADIAPQPWYWNVTENISGTPIRTYSVQLPSTLGASIDLSQLTPVVAQPAVTSYLQVAKNLSDVGSATLSRANLGLGSAATQASSAFDAAGAAATAQTAAQTFATNAVASETARAQTAEATKQNFLGITIVPAATGVYATDTANIAAAITAAGAYGTVYLPYTGTAYVADGLNPLTGQDWYGKATIQRPSTSQASVITATGIAGFTMRDGLVVDGNSASTATSNGAIYLINTTWTKLSKITVQNCPAGNSGVILRGAVRCLVEACQFTSVGYAVSLGLNHGDAYACYGNTIRGCLIDTTVNDAIFITENLGSTTGISVTGSVFGTVVEGCTVRNFGDCGVEVGSGSVYTTVSACNFIGISNGNGNQGILFRDAAHASVKACTVSNLTKPASNGVYIINLNGSNTDIDIDVNVYNCGYGVLAVGGTSPTSIGAAQKNIKISGTIDVTTADGIQLTNVSGFNLDGAQVTNTGQQGVSIGKFNTAGGGSINGTIQGCRIMNSSQSAAGQYSGLILFGASADVQVTGCRIGDDQGSHTQGYGIRIFDTTVSNVTISECDLTNGGTVSNLTNASTSAGIRAFRNLGYNPQGMLTLTALSVSPTTYTAGITPEVLYMNGGSGVSVTKNSLALPYNSASGSAYPLEPGESVTISWTTTAPTFFRTDRK